MTQDSWAQGLTQVVAEQVRRYRQSAGLSTQKLSDRCAEIGYPIPRSVLANLETGRRPMVSLAELFVLGSALNVSPVLLMLPIGQAPDVEVLPGLRLPVDEALEWLTGYSQRGIALPPFAPSTPSMPLDAWMTLARLRQHVGLMGLERARASSAGVAAYAADAAERRDDATSYEFHTEVVKEYRQLIATIRKLREDIRAAQEVAPALPIDKEHLADYLDGNKPIPGVDEEPEAEG